MLFPKKVKYRKSQRGKMRGVSSRGHRLNFGSFGLKAQEAHWVTSAQIEAARRAISRAVQRSGKVWIRIFPDKPITKKPPEVTMGGGKGDPVGFVVPVLPGRILFEIDGVSEELARTALRNAASKMPMKTKIILRD